jgi:hypothetical protein
MHVERTRSFEQVNIFPVLRGQVIAFQHMGVDEESQEHRMDEVNP